MGHIDTDNKAYYLRKGLNNFIIKESCILEIYAPAYCTDSLLMDSCRVVTGTSMQTLKLNDILAIHTVAECDTRAATDPKIYFRYYSSTEKTKASEKYIYITNNDIYTELTTYDPNLELLTITQDNDITLELNAGDTILSPRSFFDKENANNKFVISTLDTDYLTSYVGVSRFSITRSTTV
jgi:hypothetical protein